MDRSDAQRVLRCPYNDLIQLALSYINLSTKERTALDWRYQKGYTQEHTAELMQCSTNSVQNWEKAALSKCITVWDGVSWIKKIMLDK